MMYSLLRYIPWIAWKRRPIHLTFFVTRRCNAGCPYCFYLRSNEGASNAAEELSLAEIRKISRSLGRLMWLAFSGGEIYLRRDLAEISRVFYDQNKPSILLYPTNGLLPELITETTEKILRHCTRSVVVVKVSLDGLNGAHDALRQSPGGFEKAMETCRRLARFEERYPNFELGINTVFCSENQDQMDEIIDFVSGLRSVRTHTISMVRGDLVNDHYKQVDVGLYADAIERLERDLKSGKAGVYRFSGARLKAAQDIVQRRLIHRTLQAQKRQVPCYSGRLSLVLTECGDVYPCEILSTSLGNVRDHGHDMARLVRAPGARAVVDSISDNRCHCTHECNLMMSIMFSASSYPALFEEYLRLGGGHRARLAGS